MALLYGMMCTWVVVLRKLAAWKHNRRKKTYEDAELAFLAIEQDCKNDEVAMGRPADYGSQLKLMKQFESRENAKARWISAERSLNKRQRWESRITHLQGRKIPYSFGLLDMAVVIRLIDIAREAGRVDIEQIQELIASFLV